MNTKKLLTGLIALAAIPGAQAAMPMDIGAIGLIMGFRGFEFIIANIGGLIYLFTVLGFKDYKWLKRIGIIVGVFIAELIALGLSDLAQYLPGIRNIPIVPVTIIGIPCLIRLLLQITGGTEHKWRTSILFTLITFALAAILILARPL